MPVNLAAFADCVQHQCVMCVASRTSEKARNMRAIRKRSVEAKAARARRTCARFLMHTTLHKIAM